MDRFPFTHFSGRLLMTVALGGVLTACGGGGGSDDSGSGLARIQGTIGIDAGSRVDRDYADLWRVNDESWPAERNASVALPVPTTAGGYLSSAAGTHGDSLDFPEDSSDRYTVTLAAGDRYLLQCFPTDNSSVVDLNVSLSLTTGDGVDNSACGSGGTVATGGQAMLELSASGGGPFRYVLTIAPQDSLIDFNVRWPEPELRVDEAVMSGPSAVASTLSSSGQRASSMMSGMRSIGPDLWHITRDEVVGGLSTRSSAADARAETIEWIRSMRDDFGLNVEPNYLFRQYSMTPGRNTYYDGIDNWNLEQINVEGAWARAAGSWGESVGIAVLDSGMFSSDLSEAFGAWHEDLAANMVAGGSLLDFVSRGYDVDGAPGRDNDPATPLTPGLETGTSFHGTHVAGIIAAEDNRVGTLGIAHRATILPYRVLGVDPVTGEDGVGAVSDLIDAMTAAAGRGDVDVINLSLGGFPPVDAIQVATDFARRNDILVIAAAGNNGDASAIYPASNRRVVGVGATDRDGNLASYTNFGRSVDLLAPGGGTLDGVVSAYGNVDTNGALTSGYAYLAGTSMAAPHVTGVYALMRDTAGVTPDQFRAQLIAGNLTTTTPPPASSLDSYEYNRFGAGLLDANKALDPGTINDFPTVVSAWPRVLEVSATGRQSQVLLEVLKDDGETEPQVTATPTVPSPFVLTHTGGKPVEVGDSLTGSLQVRVDPDVVPGGRPFHGDIVIPHSGTGDLVIPVYTQASDRVAERTAGRHYVLLLDSDDYGSENSRVVVAGFGDGEYDYAFDDVVAGDYILVAGTDLDNNGYICENGEACAEYPEPGVRGEFSVGTGEALRLDMTTSFRRPIIAEMGLPRYGFEGYPVPGVAGDRRSADKRLQ